MALINCDECGAKVSSKAVSCPKCGNPLQPAARQHQPPPISAPPPLPASNKRRLGAGLGALLVAVIAFMVFEGRSPTSPSDQAAATVESTPTVADAAAASDAAAAAEAAKVAQNAAAAEAASVASAAAALAADQKCVADLQCAGDKYNADAAIPCERMIETRARKIAKWDYKVEREHWYSPFTDSFSWTGASHQNITFHGDQAKFQNGFGAWQRQRYSCVFNIASQKVTGAYFDMEDFEAREDATAGERAVTQNDSPPPAVPDRSGTAASIDTASVAQFTVPTPAETITASFDCKKAHSTSEMLICGDADLAALDRDLATLYAQAKAAAPDKQAFADMTRQNWNWRQRTCIDKACLVTWYADQRQRFLNILNPPAQAVQEQGQAAPPTTAAATSFTTSFSCSSVTYLDEKAICGDPGLAAMDLEMAATYAAAASTGDSERLASDQRDWLAVRRDCASDLNCLRHAYGVRTDQLRRWHG